MKYFALGILLALASGWDSEAQAASGLYTGLVQTETDVSFQMPALFAYSGATGESKSRLGWSLGVFNDLPLSERIVLRLGFEAQERRLWVSETREFNFEHPAEGLLEAVYSVSRQTLSVFGLGLPLRLQLRAAPEQPWFVSLGASLNYILRVYRTGYFEALTLAYHEDFEVSLDHPSWDLQLLLGAGFDFSLAGLDLFLAAEVASSLRDIYGEPGPLTDQTDIQGSIDDLELLSFVLQAGIRFPD